MANSVMVIGTDSPGDRRFALVWCPGCSDLHQLLIAGGASAQSRWEWDGNVEAPTFSPSLLVQGPPPSPCHSFIRAGRWEFLADSAHYLAGQTVDMVPIPGSLVP